MGAPVNFTRILDGEHVIGESNRLMSRDTVVLAPTTVVIQPGTVMGKVTANGQFVPHTTAAADGSQTAVGVLFMKAPINTATQKAVLHTRDCILNGKKMTFHAGITTPQRDAVIAALGGLNTTTGTGNVQVRY